MEESLQHGYNAIAAASATLLGLVLVALVFAYRSAINLIDRVSDFRNFAKWVGAAGLACFFYFSYCFLVAFRLMEEETSRSALYIITGAATLLLLVVQYYEVRSLVDMGRRNSGSYRGLVTVQCSVMALVFIAFEAMTWIAITRPSLESMEKLLFNSLTYILFLAALRAVVLVAASFWSIMLMHYEEKAEPGTGGQRGS